MISIPETVTIRTHDALIEKPRQFLFDPCGSMYDATSGWIVDILRLKDLENCTYQITERLTGVDLAFWISRCGDIYMSSNTGFVDSNFCDCGQLVDRYRGSLRGIWEYLMNTPRSTFSDRPCVVVYGQIVGSVLGNTNPYYGSALDFFAIELMTIQNEACNFRKPAHGRAVLTRFGIKCVPVLAITHCLTDALTYYHIGARVAVCRGSSSVISPYASNIWLFETRRLLLTRPLDSLA